MCDNLRECTLYRSVLRVQVLSFGCGCGNAESEATCIAETAEEREAE